MPEQGQEKIVEATMTCVLWVSGKLHKVLQSDKIE